ncbi:MAG: GIY-YIG nuclease family protein [bacterium]|nr:GIY-YIG nuclease family protein [bacterium]
MNGYVYILRDENGKLYVGSTDSVERRLQQHLHGHTTTTNRMKKIVLVFTQKYATLKEARNIERRLKKLKRKDYLEKIVKEGYIKMHMPSSFNG